jgi:hypothetical protein
MPDDNQSQDLTPPPVEAQAPEAPVSDVSNQSNGSTPTDLSPETPESPINAPSNVPVKDQNPGVNQLKSDTAEPSNEPSVPEAVQSQSAPAPASAPAAPTLQAPQSQSPAQQDQTGFIRTLLAKAQAKIQSNKLKKLDKIILFAQKKKIIANEDVQKLLHVSSATATRYMVKLVQQDRLARVGNPRDAKYQFIH